MSRPSIDDLDCARALLTIAINACGHVKNGSDDPDFVDDLQTSLLEAYSKLARYQGAIQRGADATKARKEADDV